MKFDPFSPMAAYRTAMDEALDAMRPARLIEEQIRELANPNSILDNFDVAGSRALASAGEQWRMQHSAMARDSLLDERLRLLNEISKIQSPFPPNAYDQLVKNAAGVSNLAADHIADYRSMMKSAMELMESVGDQVSITSQWDQLAAQLAGSLHSAVPNSYAEDYLQVVRGIDFNPIEEIVRRVAAGRPYDDDATGESSSGADDQATHATFDLIQSVTTQTVTAIFQEADRHGLLPNKRAARVKFWLDLLLKVLPIIIAATSVYLQLTHEPTAVTQSSASPAAQTPPWSGEGIFIAITKVNLRLGPSTKQRVLATINSGTFVRKRKAKADWILVEYVDPNGEGSTIKGWIRSRYLRDVGADVGLALWCAIGEPWAASEKCAIQQSPER